MKAAEAGLFVEPAASGQQQATQQTGNDRILKNDQSLFPKCLETYYTIDIGNQRTTWNSWICMFDAWKKFQKYDPKLVVKDGDLPW